MKVEISMMPDQTSNHWTLCLEDLDLTQEEWDKMNDKAKENALNDFVMNLPEQPYWCVDRFSESED